MFDTTKADQRVARKMLSRFIVVVRKPKMEAKPVPVASDFTVGQLVTVRGHGRWYPGVVVKIGQTRVSVEYTTGSGATHVKACPVGLGLTVLIKPRDAK